MAKKKRKQKGIWVDFAVCCCVNPVSEERLCLGVLMYNNATGKADFTYMKKFERLSAFNDEIDVDDVKKYLKETKERVDEDANSKKPFVMERYLVSPIKEITYPIVSSTMIMEGEDYERDISINYLLYDYGKSERKDIF